MLQSVLNKLTSPAGWITFVVQYVVARMLETRNVVGLADLIAPGSGE